MDADKFLDFWRYYQGTPGQQAGVRALFNHLGPQLQDDNAEWVRLYRSTVAAPATLLKVQWFSQNDNVSGTGYRECFSSSCAMLANFHGRIGSDDEYNRVRARYGDSTDAQAQLAALRSLGLQANFRTDGTRDILAAEVGAGRPVAVGWLHKGPASAPSGGGHWTVVIGTGPDGVTMNDPNGEADLVNGGYTANRNGARLLYSWTNWEPRWRPGGEGGWLLTCKP